MRFFVRAVLAIASLFFPFTAAEGAEKEKVPVDRMLVLAMDVSNSVSDARFALQLKGYAEAFRSSEVIRAITGGPEGKVAVTMAQWGSWGEYVQTVQWTIIRNTEDAQNFADAIEKTTRLELPGTSIAWSLLASKRLIDDAPYTAERRVIDISGDGPDETIDFLKFAFHPDSPAWKNLEGLRKRLVEQSGTDKFIQLPQARKMVCDAGIEVNGLAIEGADDVENLTEYYRKHVICSKGSFVITVENPDSYPEFLRALIRKIRHEIGAHLILPSPRQFFS
jgi:hypothetical protein